MRAVRISTPGGPEKLELVETVDPVPEAGELVVNVEAAGVNFLDIYQRSGLYPIQLPSTLGMEGAGEVVAVGEGVSNRRVGDRVAWADCLGSYAERACMPASRTVPIPKSLKTRDAAAVMLQGITAHYLVTSTVRIDDSHTVLVYAPTGGVGHILVQLAKLRGARVLACTSAEKVERARALGVDAVIPYREVDVPMAVRDLTDGEGVDVVFDSVGRDTFHDSLCSLSLRGLFVSFGQSSGPVDAFDTEELETHGSLTITRPMLSDYLADADELSWRAEAILGLVVNGRLDVDVHQLYELEQAAQAHTDLESGLTTGKLLLVP